MPQLELLSSSEMENTSNPTTSSTLPSRKRAMTQDVPPLHNFCPDNWTWNKKDRSHEVRLYGDNFKTAHFHPNWSNGTAGVRGTRILNRGHYYWEINVSQRIFGTSMMFGIGTKKARLHINAFVNMLGEDEQGWGLSHKGLLWHGGKWRPFAKPFRENEATTVGLLFDGIRGTLAYFRDGRHLGVAFTDLHLVQDELYPLVCSTAAKTEMSLGVTRRAFGDLQDRCRAVVLKLVREGDDVGELRLPGPIERYLREGVSQQQGEEEGRAARRRYCMRSSSCGPHRAAKKKHPYAEEGRKYCV